MDMNLTNKPSKAAELNPFEPGTRRGRFTVVRFLYRGKTNPNTGNCITQNRSWYEVKCDCGNVELVSGDVLAPSGRRQCVECSAEARARKIGAAMKKPRPESPVPDFARIKF